MNIIGLKGGLKMATAIKKLLCETLVLPSILRPMSQTYVTIGFYVTLHLENHGKGLFFKKEKLFKSMS